MIALIQYPRPTRGLPRKETFRLAQLAKSGDQTAVDTLVRSNDGFIKWCIWRALGSMSKTPIPQYLGTASLAFINAIMLYRKGRGAKLTTYAYRGIIQAVQRQRSAESGVIYVPRAANPQDDLNGEHRVAARRPAVSIHDSKEFRALSYTTEFNSRPDLPEDIEGRTEFA
jgi:hypothetical protein